MQIYKILHASEWAFMQQNGDTSGAPIDIADGFIHFSTAEQAQETANKHFAGITDLMLVAFEADNMGDDLVWEPSRGGALFPHLYNRTLRMDEVLWAKSLPIENGAFVFPEGIV